MKILKIDKVVFVASIIGILEAYALSLGINGTTLALSIAALAGLGGYELNDVIKRVKHE